MLAYHIQKSLFLCLLPFSIKGRDLVQLPPTQNSSMNLEDQTNWSDHVRPLVGGQKE